jgi:hypothetical protein
VTISLHRYVSTACQHEQHTGCRVVCKFCEQICLCHCHWEVKATEHTLAVHKIERDRRLNRAHNDGTGSGGGEAVLPSQYDGQGSVTPGLNDGPGVRCPDCGRVQTTGHHCYRCGGVLPALNDGYAERYEGAVERGKERHKQMLADLEPEHNDGADDAR